MRKKYEVFIRGSEVKAVSVKLNLLRQALPQKGYTLVGTLNLDTSVTDADDIIRLVRIQKKTAEQDAQAVL